ncbi:MAG: zinc-ribbon domain-containing protein [Methanobrevibacter sp.]|nr:zinc-ribbon domain-containing protein [Methanobrevibacter sp.]
MVKCMNCGQENIPDAKFCENCGASLDYEPSSEDTADVSIEDNNNESVVVDGAEESVVVDGAEESVVVDGAEESVVVDGAEESVVVDGAEESVVVDSGEESVVVDSGEESVVVDNTDESIVTDNLNGDFGSEINPSTISATEFNGSYDEYSQPYRPVYSKKPVIALLLSLFFGSLGQFYNGQILKGIIFLLVIFALFNIFYPFGLILSFLMVIYSAIDAYRNAKAITDNNGNYFYTTNEWEV